MNAARKRRYIGLAAVAVTGALISGSECLNEEQAGQLFPTLFPATDIVVIEPPNPEPTPPGLPVLVPPPDAPPGGLPPGPPPHNPVTPLPLPPISPGEVPPPEPH